MTTTTVFMNGRQQAVRIPASMRLDVDRVEIIQTDEGLLLKPMTDRQKAFEQAFAELQRFAEEEGDTFPPREQPPMPDGPDFSKD